MSDKILLTKEQFDDYKKEEYDLIYVQIPKNSEDIAAAVAQGDLSENAEYENAKDEQAKLNTHLAKVQAILKNATLIKTSDSNDYADIGHTLVVKSLDTGKEETFRLLGYNGNGDDTIAVDSPLGHALHGKEIGATVSVDAPIGELKYKIIAIK
jgi:transcription elongation factor GreA